MKSAKLCALLLAWTFAPASAQVADSEPAPPAYRPVVPVDADAAQAAAGINRFSIHLYKASIQPAENLFLSPASVSIAVGLAYRGAVGPTAEELKAGMHYFADAKAYAPANGRLLKHLNYLSANNRLMIANSLWLQDGMPLRDDFAADMAAHYEAGLQRVNFRADPDAARLKINAWVETHTNDKIKELLAEPDITVLTRAALVNTIYWKGNWHVPFPRALTKNGAFTALDGRKLTTPLMQLRSHFAVAEFAGVQAIAIPYDRSDVSMIVLMPKSARALPGFEKGLIPEAMSEWLDKLDAAEPRDTILTFPRMSLKWRNDLVDTLQNLGMKTPFSDFADFSGMAQIPYPGEVEDAVGLKISKVIHQTFLDADENGSEAAAATAVLMDIIVTGKSTAPPPPPPYIFRADKPFMFLLRDGRTRTILFMGRYVAPPAGAQAPD